MELYEKLGYKILKEKQIDDELIIEFDLLEDTIKLCKKLNLSV